MNLELLRSWSLTYCSMCGQLVHCGFKPLLSIGNAVPNHQNLHTKWYRKSNLIIVLADLGFRKQGPSA